MHVQPTPILLQLRRLIGDKMVLQIRVTKEEKENLKARVLVAHGEEKEEKKQTMGLEVPLVCQANQVNQVPRKMKGRSIRTTRLVVQLVHQVNQVLRNGKKKRVRTIRLVLQPVHQGIQVLKNTHSVILQANQVNQLNQVILVTLIAVHIRVMTLMGQLTMAIMMRVIVNMTVQIN